LNIFKIFYVIFYSFLALKRII